VNKGKRDWAALAKLPWIWTPPESAHNRLLSRIFAAAGATPVIVAEVDQEPSMLDLVKSGVGLSLARDSIALAEAHAHALTIVDGMTVQTQLSFIALAERRDEPVIAASLRLIEDQWSV
jgi:DNA-binding transcriptional LysR family regulator